MLKGAIARRYAQAIFEIGRKQNTLDRTLDDVREIARLFAHRKLAYLLREPKIPVQRKETAIRQALASKVLPTSLNLALLVVQRELVDLMQNIARELEQLVLDDKNQAIAQVTTATKLDEAQLTLVKKALEGRTGKTILMQTKVEPDILGGVIARVGDQIIDGSVRYRLAALQQQLGGQLGKMAAAGLIPAGYTLSVPSHSTTQTFAVGPQLAYRHFSKLTLFVRPVYAGAIREVATPKPGDPIAKGIIAQLLPSGKKTDWAGFAGFGGGFDILFTHHFGLRTQADLVYDHLFNDLLKDGRYTVRFSVGPAFNFGRNIVQ